MKNSKLIIKQNSKIFLAVMAIPFLLLSCNSSTKKDAIISQQNTEDVVQAPKPTQEKVVNYKYEIVSNEKVCMVNDRYMVVKQLPVEVNGITYYGCCENCVAKIQNNIGDVRYAKDPITGDKVDKASAIIVQNKKDGVVYYFGTKDLANKFIKEQG
jgi:YHS domain-containing protein